MTFIYLFWSDMLCCSKLGTCMDPSYGVGATSVVYGGMGRSCGWVEVMMGLRWAFAFDCRSAAWRADVELECGLP